MIKLESMPMLKLFVVMCIGIASSYYLHIPFYVGLVSTFLFLAAGLFLTRKKKLSIRGINLANISFLLSVFSASMFSYGWHQQYSIVEDGYYSYEAIVQKIIHQKEDYTRSLIKIIDIQDAQEIEPYVILANIYDDNVLPGDTIIAQSQIKAIPAPLNLGQFDIKKYFGYKTIYQTTSISKNRYLKYPNQSFFHFGRWCFNAAQWSSSVFEKYIPARSFLTMQALLLGKKNDIDQDMMQTYMQTGVMHVLAVSGMHVGILYLGLLLLFSPLYKRWKFFSVFPLGAIWVFAFITGAGPAVIRAALMITFVDVGKKIRADMNSVNLLFVAGCLLLVFQPYLIWDIGFQLSFAAMLGLFVFMPPLQNLFYTKNKYIRNLIWTPSVMSVSAQLATTPLAFYYFGNFPALFLFTNLIILLPVTLALYLGVSLLLGSFLLPDFLLFGLGKVLDFVLHFGFNSFLSWVVQLPGSYASQIYMASWQVLLSYVAIAFLGVWIYRIKQGRWFVLSLGMILLTTSISLARKWKLSEYQHVSILHIRDSHAIAVGDYLWTPSSSAVEVIQENSFYLGGYLRQISKKQWSLLPSAQVVQDSTILITRNKIFMILNADLRTFSAEQAIEVDYLILGEELFLDVESLLSKFKFEHLILDGGLSYRKYSLFRRLLDERGVSYIDTRTQGAVNLLL